MSTTWSTFMQNPAFLTASRMQIMNRDRATDVASRLHIKPGMKVLDVGTGTGEFIKYLAEASTGVSYTGIDLDSALIQAAKDDPFFSCDPRLGLNSQNTFQFAEGNAASLPFNDESFDIVVSHTFLTACWHYEQAIEEMRRVCKKDGLIGTINISDFSAVSSFPGGIQPGMEDWYLEYRSYQKRFTQAREIAFPTAEFNLGINPQQLPGLFSQKGFEDVSVTPIGSFFSLSNGSSTEDEKKAYIKTSQQAELDRVSSFLEMQPKNELFTEKDAEAYASLLQRRSDYLLGHIKDNACWEHAAYTYLLITAKPGSSPKDLNSEYERTKFKAADPLTTIDKIKSILKSLHIETIERFISSGIPGVYSCRVCIKGTNIGQNGKGTTPHYALASGYAEFMERLASGYLFQCDLPTGYRQKDAVTIPRFDMERACGDLLTISKKRIEGFLSAFVSNADFLKKWEFACEDEGFQAFPFKRVSDGKTEYLPEFIYRNYYYTNGSCAGNTKEEALTQGISEIMERHALMRILKEDLTPPEIPEDELKAIPGVWDIICRIRSRKNLRLKIFDASLGKGIPVVGAILLDTNLKTGRFKLGAHPRMESALERVLTEMLQGASISTVLSTGAVISLDNDRLVHTERNLFNMAKSSQGAFSHKALLSTPSWEYTGWSVAPEDQNGQYEHLLNLCRKLGWEIYIRDCSFYGFPVYHVVIPGVSMIFDSGKTPFLSAQYRKKYKDILLNLTDVSEGEKLEALNTLKLMRGWVLQETLSWNTGVPLNVKLFGKPLNYDLIKLLIDLANRSYDDVLKTLKRYSGNECFDILAEFCAAAKNDAPVAQVREFLFVLYGANEIETAERVFFNPLSCLPKVQCYHCESCGWKTKCDMPELRPILDALYVN